MVECLGFERELGLDDFGCLGSVWQTESLLCSDARHLPQGD